jgi:hypothetical protein
MHILGAIAEFERARIAERVRAGLGRARAPGKRLGRPERRVDERRERAGAGAGPAGAGSSGAARRLTGYRAPLAVAKSLAEDACLDRLESAQNGALASRAPRLI